MEPSAQTALLDLPVLTALMALPGQRDQPVLMAQMVLMAQTVLTVLMGPTVPTPHNALPLTRPLTSPLTAAITSRCLAPTILV